MTNFIGEPKDDVTSIRFRFLEIRDNGDWVIKKDAEHEDGYYSYLVYESFVESMLNLKSEEAKERLFEIYALSLNRSFMEFLLQLGINSSYIASIELVDGIEFSYIEDKYIYESTDLLDVDTTYSEEIGMMSDFDYYPYGLVKR
jgi:hypothetical protein